MFYLYVLELLITKYQNQSTVDYLIYSLMIEPHLCKFGDIQLETIIAMTQMYISVSTLDFDIPNK